MNNRPFYIVRDARGNVIAADGTFDEVLKDFADEHGAVIFDHLNNQVYPEATS
jgi:hypothetical protein